MDDLVKWLREQVAEDEQYAGNHPCDCWQTTGQCRGVMDCPARQRAQCEAHTAIVTECTDRINMDEAALATAVLKHLALAYRHRPGYQETWRP